VAALQTTCFNQVAKAGLFLQAEGGQQPHPLLQALKPPLGLLLRCSPKIARSIWKKGAVGIQIPS